MRRNREAMREKEGLCVESVWKERERESFGYLGIKGSALV